MTKVKLCCPYCGSDDVTADAVVRWDTDTQAWAITGVIYDDKTCEACGEQFDCANEVPYV